MRLVCASIALGLVASPAAAAAAQPPAGASACSGCHSPARNAPAALEGMPAPRIVEAMRAFRAGSRPATVMTRIAKGFSEEEIAAIAEWLSREPRR